MATTFELPVLPSYVDGPPPPYAILEQPSIEEKATKLERSIDDETFADIDPSVFDNELIRQKLYAADPSVPQDATAVDDDIEDNITKGTYTGTQAALTHVYRQIERR